MSIQLSKFKHYMFLLVILLTNIIAMMNFVVFPIAHNFYEVFPNSEIGVNFIISGPYIFLFLGSLAAPIASAKVPKRTLLIISCIAFALTSIFGVSVLSMVYIIVCRVVCGFCVGFVQCIAIDLIADYYVDENKRASFMGIYNAAMAGIGALMGVVAGNLAVERWQNAYYTYWAAIPLVVLVLFFIPKMKSVSTVAAEQAGEEAGKKIPMGTRFWIMLATFVVFILCNAPLISMGSVYVAENNLGTSAVSGLALSLNSVGSTILCLAFGLIFSKMKARSSVPFYAIMTLGLLLMGLVPGKLLFLAVSTICGGMYGLLFSYVYAQGSVLVAPQNVSKAISYLTAASGVAGFSGTYVVTAVRSFVPGNTISSVCLVLGIAVMLCMVVDIVNTGRMKRES